METISPITDICDGKPPFAGYACGFPHKEPLMWSFNVFVVSLNKLLSKQLSCQWFEMLLMQYHCNRLSVTAKYISDELNR